MKEQVEGLRKKIKRLVPSAAALEGNHFNLRMWKMVCKNIFNYTT